MDWTVELTEASRKDFEELDGSVKPVILKALEKIARNPLPVQEGGYGKPLGIKVHNDLSGLYKIKLMKQGIRIVYGLKRTRQTLTVVIIALRSDNEVYDLAGKRIQLMKDLDKNK